MQQGAPITTRAPAVVAVLVTTEPGPWFDETLQALAAQDYENLAVLVLAAGGADPTEMVAARLPEAFVRRLPATAGGGFGDAVAEALSMVEGASFFLLCHDDCAPAPDAVHQMVEESFRSNAGIVCPKMVDWNDPRVLLHVGQSADKTGAIVERVQDGEIDAGQHDAVRDVFVAPGGFTLVRGDLLRALGGYDRSLVALGEDLDLSWRAHVAGARVVVAPDATVRHLQLVASGRRSPPGNDAPSLQALQRRHELAAVLTCYTWTHLVRVLPQAFLLAMGEVAVALFARDRPRARAVLHAWRWNLSRRAEIRRRRSVLSGLRVLGDSEVRSLQVRGSARLSTYFSRLTHQGIDVAHGLHPGRAEAAPAATAATAATASRDGRAGTGAAALTGSIGLAFSEDSDFDDLDDLGRRGSRVRAAASAGFLATRRSRVVAGLLVAAVLIVGSRGLFGEPMPLLGQFLPFPAWTTLWHEFVASWQPAGVGSGAPASPALGFLALAGTALAGRSGLLEQVVVLGCFPVGAWGAARLLRPFASARARLAGTVAYLALPLAVDALARGRWDGLVAFAATPWVVLQLAKATGLEPFGAASGGAASGGAASGGAATDGAATDGAGTFSRWRLSLGGQVVALGAIEAVAMSFAPAMVVVVLVAGLGIALGSLVAGGVRRGARALLAAVAGTLLAAVLCTPWVVWTLSSGRGALSVLGLATGHAGAPGWAGLLRMAVGPLGSSPLAWLLFAAALPVVLLGRGARLAWAIRLWAVAVPAWLVALVATKGWAVPFAPSVDVLLAPAAVAVAASIGLGVASFETDLAGYGFGWRQGLAALSVAAIVAGVLPFVIDAGGGRWGLPSSGYEAVAALPAPRHASADYRVLWLGDPRALPAGAWSIGPGLAYATSTDGTPTLEDLWPPGSPGKAGRLATAVRVAMRGETARLGQVLAGARVRYVVVVGALAPRTPGAAAGPQYPVPSGLVRALARQEDLRTVPVGPGGVTIFENTGFGAGFSRTAGVVSAPARGGGTARLLDPVGAAGELAAWVVVAAALLGRRRWLDWWWQPLVRVRRRRRAGRRLVVPVEPSAPVAGADAEQEDPAWVPALVGAAVADATPARPVPEPPPGPDLQQVDE
jgi:GT2 family glycosyltransferase